MLDHSGKTTPSENEHVPNNSEVDQALQQALIHHKAGQLHEAETLYRRILQDRPLHPDANHNLGVLAAQLGQIQLALPFFSTALEVDLEREQFWLSYLDSLFRLGELDAARELLRLGRDAGHLQGDAAESISAQLLPTKEFLPVQVPLAPKGKSKRLSQRQIASLETLFNSGRYRDLELRARELIQDHPLDPFAWSCLGGALQVLGQAEDAVTAMRHALKLSPRDADIHNNLGVVLYDLGRLSEAEACCRKAISIKPGLASAHNNLANVLSSQRRLPEAEASYRRAISLNPAGAEAHSNLGNVLRSKGCLPEAEASYRRALSLKPDYAEATNNLGNTLRDMERLPEAVACYRQAIGLNPGFAEAHNNLGVVLKDLGQFAEAVSSYRRALELNADYPEGWNNLGVGLKEMSLAAEAEASFRHAIELKPDYAEALNNLGSELIERKALDEAESTFRRAIELKPDVADFYNNLGLALAELHRLPETEACYRRAIELKPDSPQIHSNFATALSDLGRLDEAVACFQKSAFLNKNGFEYSVAAHLLLPAIPQSAADICRWRERFSLGIEALHTVSGTLPNPGRSLGGLAFNLAYHNADDKSLMVALAKLFSAKLPQLAFTSPHLANWQPPGAGQRIRVGFLSQFLVGHTIGKLYQGFVHQLDRDRFHVVIIHAPKTQLDSFSSRLDLAADEVIRLPAELAAQQEAVSDARLDVLFYPDIGMSPATYFLAYARLAPVQAVSWGHPDTTGLDSMDYFVSAASIEPEDAEAHYSERLIRLPRLPCFYQPVSLPNPILDRISLGLPESGTLYGCPQSLFKLHPDFDAVLAQIAGGDPSGHIILLEGKNKTSMELVKRRWENTFPILLERVRFLGYQPQDRFMALMANFDVLLDPIYFGSGNTLYESIVYGTPIVTWPGPFMRGRIVAGAYRQIGLDDAPVVLRLEDYAPLALALGSNAGRRRILREAIGRLGRSLFEDHQSVSDFEAFLEAAVRAAARAEKLPGSWRPDARNTED